MVPPRLEFLQLVEAGRSQGAVNPAWFKHPPVPLALINAVWAGASAESVLADFDRSREQNALRLDWESRIGVHLDRLAEEAARGAWAALETAGVRERHKLWRWSCDAATVAMRRGRGLTGSLLLARPALAFARRVTLLHAAWGHGMVRRLPVRCDLLRAIDARVFPGGSGASSALVHVFPTTPAAGWPPPPSSRTAPRTKKEILEPRR
jgi:hypothetical protein